MKKLIFLLPVLVLIISVIFLLKLFLHQTYSGSFNKNISSNFSIPNFSTIYLCYSETCPHCGHLTSYLETLNLKRTKIYKTKDSAFTYKCLLKLGIRWDFGVPIVFAKTKNETIVIQGYPSSSQEKDGYFLGKEIEKKICEQSKGTPFFDKNGNYLFCKLPNGIILGNRYAINYLINKCEREVCEKIC